ncbi:MAG: histidine phosphatase family protein [Thermodesulfobacteriota bacterium]
MIDKSVTRLSLLRHSITYWNKEHRIQGHADSNLSPEGILLAKQWEVRLREMGFERIVASPLGRVRETVALINSIMDLPVEFDNNLKEQHWGDWQGATLAELKSCHGEELGKQVAAGWDFCPPGGESRHQVYKRSRQAIDRLTTKYPGSHILIVCHEGIIKTLVYHLLGRKFLPGEKKVLDSNQMHRLTVQDATLRIEELNCWQNRV